MTTTATFRSFWTRSVLYFLLGDNYSPLSRFVADAIRPDPNQRGEITELILAALAKAGVELTLEDVERVRAFTDIERIRWINKLVRKIGHDLEIEILPSFA